MFFRFGGAVILLVVISLQGISLEKQTLDLRRGVSRQAFRLDALLERHAALRLRTQQLGAPARLRPIPPPTAEGDLPNRAAAFPPPGDFAGSAELLQEDRSADSAVR